MHLSGNNYGINRFKNLPQNSQPKQTQHPETKDKIHGQKTLCPSCGGIGCSDCNWTGYKYVIYSTKETVSKNDAQT